MEVKAGQIVKERLSGPAARVETDVPPERKTLAITPLGGGGRKSGRTSPWWNTTAAA